MRRYRVKSVAAILVMLAVAGILIGILVVKYRVSERGAKISAGEARESLLKLKSLRVISGDDNDPVFKDLKTGAIVETETGEIRIGNFIRCDLKKKTWRMHIGVPSMLGRPFAAGAEGIFERQPDGTWAAVEKESYIT